MIMPEWNALEGHFRPCCVHLNAFVYYRRLSPHFQFSLSVDSLGYLSQCVSCTLKSSKVTRELEHTVFCLA
jgi:hypothetical protein